MNANEQLLSLADACKVLPTRRGKPPHASTLWRWSRHGRRGVVLETVVVGGGVYTSREAIERFITRLTERRNAPPPLPPTRGRKAQQREAKRLLDRLRV